ncbi:unnamed protein product [Trichogramma brassicae]|uniref:Integrase catalytic domain-containing protein n=1 Tax=Trichogramma brassicae TaxID=86971 RepID=A0A6H5IYI7_9HYME|nr:unnamed protein product [Trichogramma brassicae]
MDRQTEKYVKNCRDCLMVSQPNKSTPMSRHEFPTGPWQCLAIDLMGPLPNKEMIFVIIDYYSRFQEIKFLSSTTSTSIIKNLSEIFSRFGYPKKLRADNGPQFASSEFKNFCSLNNIELIQTPSYWPQSNGEITTRGAPRVTHGANTRHYRHTTTSPPRCLYAHSQQIHTLNNCIFLSTSEFFYKYPRFYSRKGCSRRFFISLFCAATSLSPERFTLLPQDRLFASDQFVTSVEIYTMDNQHFQNFD